MPEIQLFQSEEFGELRTFVDGDKVWFCGTDVAKALGYAKPNNALRTHCKGDALKRGITDSLGREQEARFIAEGDFYRLVVGSKLPGAQRFESWVFDDVLPAIRRRGGYMSARADETPEQVMARALLIAKDALECKDREIEELRPKALFADAVAASDGTCLIGELAKMMRQNGFEVGQNRLFAILREDCYLGKTGCNRNVPTQRAMEMGLFRIKETAITHSDGHVSITRTPKVTAKGQVYFINRYCKQGSRVAV